MTRDGEPPLHASASRHSSLPGTPEGDVGTTLSVRGHAGDAHGDAARAGLAISGLRAGYGKRDVIVDLSLDGLRPGEIAAVLGPNGSGKSTLLKAVAGLLPPRAGTISLDGHELATLKPMARSRLLAYMPQDLPGAVHLRVLEAVLTASRAAPDRRPPAEPEVAQALLSRLGIGHLALSYLDELSGGQRQLTGLALALIREPRVLLLDEPLSALDLRHQFEVIALLKLETRARGLITMMAVHDLNVALRHAEHAMLLRDGALVTEGAPADVIRPDTLADVYGVRGRIVRGEGGLLHVLIDGL
jgi:iron complex transport system ATP-binding protein